MRQRGPEFLSNPVKDWPMKSASEVAANARETASQLQRKAFLAVLTRAQAKKLSNPDSPGGEGPVVADGVSGAPEPSGNGAKPTLVETKEMETPCS